jgi:diguanylate cyclase (GGDEF)-like protein
MYLLTRSRKIVNYLLQEKKTLGNLLICILLFTVPIILTSNFGIPVMEVKTNLRTSLVFFSAIVGGPICSLVIGIIGSLYRFTLGGWTGFACAAATLGGGIVASLAVYKTKNSPSKLSWKAIGLWTLLVFIWENIHVLIFIPLLSGQPSSATVHLLLNQIYLPQITANTLTMLILCFLMRDLVTLDTRILSEKQKKWLQETLTFTHELEVKVEERTKELAEANKKLYESSIRDPLTSLYNRKYLQEIILKENSKLAKYYYQCYSALCIDLDNFKTYNDRYGHLAGDIILQEFAGTLKKQINDSGLIFRTGGDEFTVLLPNINIQNAVLLAQEIISELEKANSFKGKIKSSIHEEVLESNERLSCSIGIKTILTDPKANTTIESGRNPNPKIDKVDLNNLLYLADKRLLNAKIMGKNQYSLSS